MCNPTTIPPSSTATPSSASSSTPSRMPPASPASTSTTSGMGSSIRTRSQNNSHHRNDYCNDNCNHSPQEVENTDANGPPRLKLVVRRRTASESADANQSHHDRNRPLHARQESRDEDFREQMGMGIPAQEFLLRSQTPSPHQQQDEEEDVPDLLDEDETPHWRGPRQTRQQQHQHHQQQQNLTKEAEQQQQPFFMLDWMLEDLVPREQNAQDLADLLRQQEEQEASFRILRKTQSLPASRNSSPIQKLLPWLASPFQRNQPPRKQQEELQEERKPERKPSLPIFVHKQQQRQQCTTTNTNERSRTPPKDDYMPNTPKSSNRRACRMRKKLASQRRECVLAAANADANPGLLVPLNLDQKLASASKAEGGQQQIKPRQLSPRLHARKPSSSAPPSPMITYTKGIINVNTNTDMNVKTSMDMSMPPMDLNLNHHTSPSPSPTKKSASCPQFLTEAEEELQQRKRQEQIERRERRSKLTIVQRSLTLAQSWNNKGLAKAGRATQAEQQEAQGILVTATTSSTTANGMDSETTLVTAHALWESSLMCWDNALEIYGSLLGDSHEKVADVQNNRGIALGKLRRFEQALEALGIALVARKKQHQKSKLQANSKKQQLRAAATAAASTAAIVSTLHNIANVYRDANDPHKALAALLEAQSLLLHSSSEEQSQQLRSSCSEYVLHRFHSMQQASRLSTAIGHVYYESGSWRKARDSYNQALQTYDKLSRSIADQASSHKQQDQERFQWMQYQHSIQREVGMLEDDLDELERQQQAMEGTRARLLQVRQQELRSSPQRRSHQQQQQQQQEPAPSTTPPTNLLTFVTSLRT